MNREICSYIRKQLKMKIFSIIIGILKVIPVKILIIETDEKSLKFIRQYKIPRTPKTILKETRVGRLKRPDLRLTIKLQQPRECSIDRRINTWNNIAKIDLCLCSQLIFFLQQHRNSVGIIKWFWATEYSYLKSNWPFLPFYRNEIGMRQGPEHKSSAINLCMQRQEKTLAIFK